MEIDRIGYITQVADLRGAYDARGLSLDELRAVYASLPSAFENDGDGKMHSPPKQNKQHKSRAKPRVPAQPLPMPQPAVGEVQTPVATAAGVPVPFLVHNAPLVAATPLPMQPLCYAPML